MEKKPRTKKDIRRQILAVRRTLPVEEAKEKSREIFQKVTAHPWYIEADTVFCYSNEGASGAVQSAEEKGAKFVAFAANKNDESDCVVASVNMNWSNVYPWIVKGIASGELKGAQEVGVAEGVFEPIYTDAVTDECKSAVDQAVQDITDGKIDFTQYFSEAE